MRYSCSKILAFVFLLASFVPVFFWQRLAEARVPVHFNYAGEPDRWGDGCSIFLLPLLSCVLYVLMLCSARKPQLINWPINVSKEEKAELIPYAVPFVQRINVLAMMLLSYLSNGSFMVALGHWKKLPVLPLYAIVCLIIVLIAVFCRKIVVLRKRLGENR